MKKLDRCLSVLVWGALLILILLSGGMFPDSSMACSVALSVAIFLSMITKRPVYRAFFVSKDRLRHPFKNVPSAAVFVLLFLWAVPLTFWAIDPYSHLKGLVKWLPLLLWLFLCVQMEDPQKERIFALIPLAGAVITVAGLLSLPFPAAKSLLFLADRFCGTFQYANTCALFLSLGIIILTERLLSSLSVRNLILLAILLAGLLLTGSRSVLILLWIWGLYKCFRTKRMRLPFLILTVSVAAFAFLYTAITGNLQNIGRILTVFSHQSTIWGRLLYDKDACRILLHHPFGLGFDGYKYLQPVMQTGVYTTRYVHNDLLQVMLDLGVIPGLILLYVLLMQIIKGGQKKQRKELLLFISISSLVDFHLQFLLIVMIGILCLDLPREKRKTAVARREEKMFALLFALAFLILLVPFTAMRFGSNALALRFFPNDTDCLLQQMNATTQAEEAQNYAKRILDHNALVSEAHYQLAYFAMLQGNYEEVISHMDTVISINRYNSGDYELYAGILMKIIMSYEGMRMDPDMTRVRDLAVERLRALPGILAALKDTTDPLAYRLRDVPVFTFEQ